MTNLVRSSTAASVLLSLLLISLAALPAATAHGAIEPREIDTRVLVDHDGLLGPSACGTAPAPQGCDNQPKGLDLVSLDMRETHWTMESVPALNGSVNGTAPLNASLVPGTPVVVFRVTVQENAGAPGQAVEIHATAGGSEHHFGFASDASGNYTSDSCAALAGPLTVAGGDGDQRAFDCYVSHESLGLNMTGGNATAAIIGIEVHSDVDGAAFDVMPGTWYLNGQAVPYFPDETPGGAGDLEAHDEPGTYNVTGPAQLMTASLSAQGVDLAQGPASVQVRLASLLNATEQVATLTLTAPTGIQAALADETVILGEDRNVTLNVSDADRNGLLTVTVTSELGAYHVLTLAVTAPPPEPTCPPGTNATNGVCPTVTDTTTDQASPAPEMVFVGTALLALAFVRRRWT